MIGDTTENNTIPEDKKFTLDLGEQTITGGIINNGEMIIEGNGTITTKTSNILENNGTLTINSGNFIKEDGSNERVFANLGTAIVNGGYFDRTVDGWTIENLGEFYINDGLIKMSFVNGAGTAFYNSAGNLYMSGGTIDTKMFGLVVNGGNAKTTGGFLRSVYVRNNGSAEIISTEISNPSSWAVINDKNYTDLIIRSRSENYGITGGITGKVIETSNIGPGQSSETIQICNTGYNYLTFPTWTSKNSQDDIEWIASYSSHGSHKVTISKSKHNNESGLYKVDIYSANSSYYPVTFLAGITLEF